jgi:hypothetical protein
MRLPRVERARLLTVLLSQDERFIGARRVLQALWLFYLVLGYVSNTLTDFYDGFDMYSRSMSRRLQNSTQPLSNPNPSDAETEVQ